MTHAKPFSSLSLDRELPETVPFVATADVDASGGRGHPMPRDQWLSTFALPMKTNHRIVLEMMLGDRRHLFSKDDLRKMLLTVRSGELGDECDEAASELQRLIDAP